MTGKTYDWRNEEEITEDGGYFSASRTTINLNTKKY